MIGENTVIKKASIKTNMFMNTVLTGSKFVFPLIIYAYVARVLMATGLGQVAFVQSILGYIGFIATLGIPSYATRECAKYRDNKDKLSKFVQEMLIINLISTVFAYVVLGIAVISIRKLQDYTALFFVMSWSLVLNTIGVEWLYQGLEKFTYIAVRSLIFKVISIALVFLFIKSPDDVLIYGAISIFVTSASNVLNFINARKYISLKYYGNYDIIIHLRPILFFFMSTVVISIYGHLDSVMLGFLKGDKTVGLYDAVLKIKLTVLSVSTAITSVLIPRLSYYVGIKDYSKYKDLLIKSTKVSLLLMLPVSVFILIFSEEVICVLCGTGFLPAILTVKIAMLCVIVMSVTNLLGNQILIPNEKEKHFSKTVSMALVINLIGNFLLIPRLGMEGAAISTFITELFNAVWFAKECKEEIKYIFKEIKFAVYVIPLLLSACLGIVLSNSLSIQSYFFRIVIFAVSYFILYYVILYLEKEEIVKLGVNSVVRIIKNVFL